MLLRIQGLHQLPVQVLLRSSSLWEHVRTKSGNKEEIEVEAESDNVTTHESLMNRRINGSGDNL